MSFRHVFALIAKVLKRNLVDSVCTDIYPIFNKYTHFWNRGTVMRDESGDTTVRALVVSKL